MIESGIIQSFSDELVKEAGTGGKIMGGLLRGAGGVAKKVGRGWEQAGRDLPGIARFFEERGLRKGLGVAAKRVKGKAKTEIGSALKRGGGKLQSSGAREAMKAYKE